MSDFLLGYPATIDAAPAMTPNWRCRDCRAALFAYDARRRCGSCTMKAERDDARLEADRLKGEVARLAKARDDAWLDAEALRKQRDEATAEAKKLKVERDSPYHPANIARLEAEDKLVGLRAGINVLKAERDAIFKERDEARAGAEKLRGLQWAASQSAEPLKPCQGKAAVLKGLDAIRNCIGARTMENQPNDAWYRLAQISGVVGHLIATLRD